MEALHSDALGVVVVGASTDQAVDGACLRVASTQEDRR